MIARRCGIWPSFTLRRAGCSVDSQVEGLLRDENGNVQTALPDLPTFGAFLFRDLKLPAGSAAASLREQVTDGVERLTFEGLLDELTVLE